MVLTENNNSSSQNAIGLGQLPVSSEKYSNVNCYLYH